MDKTKTIVTIVLMLCFGYIIWSQVVITKAQGEITYLREANELKREIIVTYGSYEQACDEIFLHNSEAGWDSLYAAQEKLDSLFEHEL